MHYNTLADTNKNKYVVKDEVKTSDILKMSQDIFGDWLKREAEKKVHIQEMLENQKQGGRVGSSRKS